MRRRITTSGNSAALVLSQDLLGLMGVGVGDEVDVSLVDRTLVVRSLSEAERSAKVQNAIDEVFRRDAGVLRRLGEGVTADESARSSGRDAKETAKKTAKK
jgi:antitoxin component of MazEF toxin-antitoxin module